MLSLPKQTQPQNRATARSIPTNVVLLPCNHLAHKAAQAAAILQDLLAKPFNLLSRPLPLNRVLQK